MDTSQPSHPALRVGFAKRDITPAPDVFLAGNGHHQSTGIHDPLYARAVVVRDATSWVALVSCDLIGIDPPTVAAVRRQLRGLRGIQSAHLFISCTHTHNGPHTRFSRREFTQYRDPGYLHQLAMAIAGAIRQAHENVQPATMSSARGLALENFNRRLVTADGIAHFYNPRTIRENPAYAQLAGGVTDTELNAVRFHAGDGSTLLTLVQYAAHPLTVGVFEHVISTDYCGALVDDIEAATKAPAIFFQGACGDLHCKGLFTGFGRRREMGKTLATEALRILEAPCPHDSAPRLSLRKTRIELPIDPEKRHNGTWDPDYFAPPYKVEMAAVAIGPVVFITLPGELCCEPGLQIKWNAPFSQSWFLYNCNAYSGYILLPRAQAEGGYEAGCNCLATAAGAKIVATALHLCQALHRGNTRS